VSRHDSKHGKVPTACISSLGCGVEVALTLVRTLEINIEEHRLHRPRVPSPDSARETSGPCRFPSDDLAELC